MADSPLIDANPTHYLKRIDRDTPSLQFIRELVQNGIEANATRIEIEPFDFHSYMNKGTPRSVQKMMITDNGDGMTPKVMFENLAKMNSSSKSSSSACHENYGIGAKVTTTMWNPYGVVFLSWSKDDPENGHMVWLHYNDDFKQICLKSFKQKFEDEDGDVFEEWLTTTVNGNEENVIPLTDDEGEAYDLGFDWNSLRPKEGHGTVVLLLGDNLEDDTWTDSRKERLSDRALRYYLNLRYSRLPEGLNLRVKTTGKVPGFYESLKSMPDGFLEATETLVCPNGFEVDVLVTKKHSTWFKSYKKKRGHSYKGGTSGVNSNFMQESFNKGFVAIEYKGSCANELYNVKTGVKNLYPWGISNLEVAKKVKLIVRAPQVNEDEGVFEGVYQNEGRYQLQWMGNSESNEVDLTEVQDYFVQNQPKVIKDLLEEAFEGYTTKSVDVDKLKNKYLGLFDSKKSLSRSIVADDNGHLMFNPASRSKPTNTGSHPNTNNGETKRKTGTQSSSGKMRGSSTKSQQEITVRPIIHPYIKGSENNKTELHNHNGSLYPVAMELKPGTSNEFNLYLMENHDYFVSLYNQFIGNKVTLTAKVIRQHVMREHIAHFQLHMSHLYSIKGIRDKKAFYDPVVLYGKLLGNVALWDRIARNLSNVGK